VGLPASLVQREGGLHRSGLVLEQPADPGAAGFLVAGPGEDDVALERRPLALQQHQDLERERRHAEVVRDASPDEVAVALDDFVRVARPGLALGADHVRVREEQQRRRRAVAAQPCHEVLAPRRELRAP
jgi:hypothetical protein